MWECANGGQLWSDSGISDTGTIPSGFCAAGFETLNIAFIISLLVDIVFQVKQFLFLGFWTRGRHFILALHVFPCLAVLQTIGTLFEYEAFLWR